MGRIIGPAFKFWRSVTVWNKVKKAIVAAKIDFIPC